MSERFNNVTGIPCPDECWLVADLKEIQLPERFLSVADARAVYEWLGKVIPAADTIAKPQESLASKLVAELRELREIGRSISLLRESQIEEICYRIEAALADGETGAVARDADHCDFPDCEQHWTLVVQQLLAQCEEYHRALDTMFARMIEKTATEQPHCFFPTESGQPWEACQKGHALIQSVRAALKTSAPRPDCPHSECTRSPACGEHCQEPI